MIWDRWGGKMIVHRGVHLPSGRRKSLWSMPAVIGIILSIPTMTSAVDQSVSPSASIGGHEAKFADVNGARTRYYDAGSGEAILLIHGARPSGTSSANTWVPILTGLGKRFRVLAPEERRAAIGLGTGAGGSRGASDDPKEQFRFAHQQLSKNREHITEEFVLAAGYMASLPGGKKTDAAMRGEAAKRYEMIIAQGASEMREWIKQGKLQAPTLLYWGKNDPSAILAVGLALF